MRLVVYDAAGNEVATLADGTLQSGEHTVSFDGANIASGIYFYRLEAGAYSSTKKFVLLK